MTEESINTLVWVSICIQYSGRTSPGIHDSCKSIVPDMLLVSEPLLFSKDLSYDLGRYQYFNLSVNIYSNSCRTSPGIHDSCKAIVPDMLLVSEPLHISKDISYDCGRYQYFSWSINMYSNSGRTSPGIHDSCKSIVPDILLVSEPLLISKDLSYDWGRYQYFSWSVNMYSNSGRTSPGIHEDPWIGCSLKLLVSYESNKRNSFLAGCQSVRLFYIIK